ncbi:tetratricopeptide repeat protein [Kineobactrum salinum]|uniref:Tetratricopeptide repeat protein n=1 Tax=Kineobactrum salinum TaxID=2708301 RepID=A0A6C0U0R9_9GAMM|nr:tetratricopeptide repeat protein [Kineobactrum salinum]QIB65498.1 tetratricopeptide repeat protein [Kineobactrum salinum]
MLYRHLMRTLITALALSTLAACAVQPPVQRAVSVSRAQLLAGERLDVAPEAALAPVALTAINEDMRAFLRQHVPPDAGDSRKIHLILQAILKDGLQLRYDNFRTYTAEEAFYSREGNCMSFTNLFVALAREAGVNARYQEVEIPPSWAAEGETWLYNLHINALVKLPHGEQVVDFNLEEYNREFRRRILSDEEALARYHNNMGVHWMGEENPERALLHLRAALELRPRTAHVWTNLGTLYRREGDPEAAEAAYLLAIDIGDEAAAHSNLARLYHELGEADLSAWHRDRVQLFRRKNPYYLYHLAEQAYANANYPKAQRLLQGAIRQHRQEHEFHRLLGLTYLQLGDRNAARKRFQQALELSRDEDQLRYRHKLDLLAER